MSEDSDYTQSSWSSNHDFSSSRRSYDNHRQQSQRESVKIEDVKTEDLVPESIRVDSEYLVVIVSDLTASMDDWPGVYASKFPYMDFEAKGFYYGNNINYLFTGFCDADGDKYPAQILQPCDGKSIESRLKEFKFERGCGGANGKESPELIALYLARKVFTPNLKHKPLVIFISDEAPYDVVKKEWAERYLNIKIKEDISTEKVFQELKERFSVYHVKKPYQDSCSDNMNRTDRLIYEKWVSLVGKDHVCLLEDCDRIVDITFAIMACESGKIDYCIQEFNQRQGEDDDYKEKKRIFDFATSAIFAKFQEGQNAIRKNDMTGKKMKPLFDEEE